MLVGLKQPLLKGQHVPLTLRFERAGEVHVVLEVMASGAAKPHH
jgi:copper(I)-binding protein